ncbi:MULTISPECIES: flagellar assembly protein FliH [unclassified Halomonas]|uniref:flagellar assembly protein FliH n=1 Tax=unclassified Halomonas TaxID=2609666 RepID=UPI001C97BF13|nr:MULTISPECIES: flagellar assembly protein FliH [unclassified Halomonas]MBY5926551.1 flagellar assembly protein FliH [Halomonas sp. DP4Y7-2]MBY6233736.1 flagellar assembly protein FliH [Halomonas sp. DP4Y7-1]
MSHWRRWNMGALPEDADEAPAPDTPTRNELAAERQRARDAGHREGHAQGHQQGFDAGHAKGYQQGLEQGLAAGRAQAEQEIAAAIDTRSEEALAPLAQLVEDFQAALMQLDDAVAEQLTDLALATGRQLAGEALKARPRQVVELVQQLLHTDPPLVGRQRLWLHPLDLRLVERHLGEQLETAGWTLRVDERLHRGGCRVSGDQGDIDATWERRWQAVTAQVRRRAPRETDDDGTSGEDGAP